MNACPDCLRRTALLAAVSPDVERRWTASRPSGLLARGDADLVAALTPRGAARDEAPEGATSPIGTRAAAVAALRDDELLARARADAAAHGLHLVCRHDDAYPRRLDDLDDPPAVLHVLGDRGRLDRERERAVVAIVGARRASVDAAAMARRIGFGVASAGATVISGMAFGVDAAAHEGALAAGPQGGGTVAVLGGGVERAHPARLRDLHARIAAQGAVAGELPVGATPRRWTFPARNRLIAALADVVLVVEATERSGSLITAGIAADVGRDLAAVPGSAVDARCAGTNALLRDGARVVLGPDDVVAMVQERLPRPVAPAAPAADAGLEGLDGGLRATAVALGPGPLRLDELLERRGEDPDLLVHLGELEAMGRVRRRADGRLALLPPGGV